MGTIVTLDLYGRCSGGPALTALAEACRLLHEADELFSTWRDESPMSRLRGGALSLADAPHEVRVVLRRCEDARRWSDGWFDPWAMPGGVDPTGLVKGWAAQRALDALRPARPLGAIVNAAGDVAVFGAPGPGEPFRVGIVDPFDRSRLACAVEVRGAVATSGTYERGAHLVDPRTGSPTAAVASATVCGPDLGLADALATALAVSGDLAAVARADGYEALVIDHDGRWRATRSFPFLGAAETTSATLVR